MTASQAFNIPLEEVTSSLRRDAKAINFGIIYGMGAFGLAKQLNISNNEAKEYIKSYFEQFPEIAQYIEEQKQIALQQEYVKTFNGRKCFLPSLAKSSTHKQRVAINAPIQGGAADIIKLAMVNVDNMLKSNPQLRAKILLQVHDELIIEVAKEQSKEVSELIKKQMEDITNILLLSVNLITEMGIADNWLLAH